MVFLLWILALSAFVTFCYFASSLCVTVLLASFLAILADPVVMYCERFRVGRMFSSAVVMIVGTALLVILSYATYKQMSQVVDELPTYTDRLRRELAPLLKKMQRAEDSAGRIATTVPTKKVPEVKITNNTPDWASYVARGAGSVSGAAIIIGVVPFLMFFLLVHKRRVKQKLAIVWGHQMDVSALATNATRMIRAFVLGNLIIGGGMAGVTMLVLFALKVDNPVVLGLVSGLLNLIPFAGAIAASLVPMLAALMQGLPLSAFLVIAVTVVGLHLVSTNLLMPKFIGERVSISPVAAILGILFWGWLWGVIGILLAIPMTALVKIVADAQPSLAKISNLLAERPVGVPPWSRSEQAFASRESGSKELNGGWNAPRRRER